MDADIPDKEQKKSLAFVLPRAVTRIELVYTEPSASYEIEAAVRATLAVPATDSLPPRILPLLPSLWQVFDAETRHVSFVRWDTSSRILAAHYEKQRLTLVAKSIGSTKSWISDDTSWCGCHCTEWVAPTATQADVQATTQEATAPTVVCADTLAKAGFVVDDTTGIWTHPKCYNHVYRMRSQRLTWHDREETSWLVRGKRVADLPLSHLVLRDTAIDQHQQIVTLYADTNWDAHTVRHMSLAARTALSRVRLVFQADGPANPTFTLTRE